MNVENLSFLRIYHEPFVAGALLRAGPSPQP